MANTLKFKRGLVAGIPTAALGEPLFTTDTFDLYIGNGTGNTRFQKYIASGTTSQLLRGDGSLLTMPIVLTSPSNGQVLKYNGTNWVNDSDAGITGSGTTNYLPKFTGASTLGNSLVYDNGTNVGIGTASPNGKLQINNGTDLNIAFNTVANDATTVSRISSINDAATLSTPLVINGSRLVFTTNAVEAMRITSTRNLIVNSTTDNGLRFQVTGDGYFSGSVGIGTSPSYKLHVLTAATATRQTLSNINRTTANWVRFTNPQYSVDASMGLMLKVFPDSDDRQGAGIIASGGPNNGDTNLALFVSSGVASSTSFAAYSTIINGAAVGHSFYNGAGTTAMTLDVNGNLGLGVTPSAWIAGVKSMEYLSKGNSVVSGASTQMIITANAYFDGSWKYGTNGVASYYQQINAVHSWHNAISGSANGLITFTQAMTLDASGRLGIGVTSPSYKLDVSGSAGFITNFTGGTPIGIYSDASTAGLFNAAGTNGFMIAPSSNSLYFTTNSLPRVYIFSDGNVGIATGNSNAGYKLDVNGTMRVSGASTFSNTVTSTQFTSLSASGIAAFFLKDTGAVNKWEIGHSANSLYFYNYTNANNNLILNGSTGAATFSSSVTAANNSVVIRGNGTNNTVVSSATLWSDTAPLISVYNASTTTNTGAGFQMQVGGGSAIAGILGIAESTTQASLAFFSGGNGTVAEKMRIFSDGNVSIGTTTNATYKLDVNGTMRVSGFLTGNNNAAFGQAIESTIRLVTASSGNTNASIALAARNLAGTMGFAVYGDLTSYFGGAATFSSSVTAANLYSTGASNFATSSGTVGIGTTTTDGALNVWSKNNSVAQILGYAGTSIQVPAFGFYATNINTLDGGLDIKTSNNGVFTTALSLSHNQAATFSSSVTAASFNGTTNNIFSVSGTEGMRLTSTGLGIGMTPSYKLDVTGQARISDAIAIGTTPDTNLPFKILKNINSTVGIRFENTSTGASSFTGYQFGTDVSGGTAFTNFLYASSGVTETGVYKPNGTALINTGSGGLNFLAVSQPIRFFTSTGTGTLRAAITNDGDFTQYNGTNPSASTTDAFRMYSADITAGNAAPHFRTENGGIIKLYQQTTAVTSATYIGGAGTTVTDLDTFDGYTIPQIVKALRNAGLLA